MNQDKQKIRFNFVDALIILIILAVVGAAVYLIVSGSSEGIGTGKAVVSFTVRISSVDEASLPLIRENGVVKNSSSGKPIGTIRAVRTEKTRYYGTTAIPAESGGYTVATTEYTDKYDVYVTISAGAEKGKNDVYRTDDIRLLIGSPLNFKVPYFAQVSYIVDVTPPEIPEKNQ